MTGARSLALASLLPSLLFILPFWSPSPVGAADRPTPQALALSLDSPALAPPALTAAIPARQPGARSGSQFVSYVHGMDGAARERAIRAELLAGNIPSFLRSLKKIELAGGAVVWVMPDYLAIGSDEDFVRFPASFETATAVARLFGFVLPTTTIVDAIYHQATLRLSPQTMAPGPAMTSTAYFEAHDRKIRAQAVGHRPGELLAGHKKDYVVTNRLATARTQEAIYGWHRGIGSPIQPLSLVHGTRYADYSHGVRLVAETVYLGGEARSFYDLLEAQHQASLLSREGAIPEARSLMSRWSSPPEKPPITGPTLAAKGEFCSSEIPGGNSGGSSDPSLGCRANTAPASGTSLRAPGNGRR